jgi:hypothetical protein
MNEGGGDQQNETELRPTEAVFKLSMAFWDLL